MTRDSEGSRRTPPYDVFISYSHAADDALAPRLQSALQRFAKPWWKRQILRVFRDESSLAASPHLWESITDALDRAEWFVLLLSPAAAQSEWVNKEIEYWLEAKARDRIIPVLTEGEFDWSRRASAVPPTLEGVFESEPRWVDLRFARTDDQLDLKNPEFSDAVADIASAVRQTPKDELHSEEIRQHRRIVRTASAAAAALALLAVVATAAALVAINESAEADMQRDDAQRSAEAEASARAEADANAAEAERQQAIAEQNAGEADRQRESAEQAAQRAELERAEAERQSLAALAQAWTLQARDQVSVDPELSTMLALDAVKALREVGSDPQLAVSVLRAALQRNDLVWRADGGRFVAVDPTEQFVATAAGADVAVVEIASGTVKVLPRTDGAIAQAADFSPDGRTLAVLYNDTDRPLRLWDLEDSSSVDLGDARRFRVASSVTFSGDGGYVAVGLGLVVGNRLEYWSVDDHELVLVESGAVGLPSFSTDGRLVFGECEEDGECVVRFVDPQTGEATESPALDQPVLFAVPSHDGQAVIVGDQSTLSIVDAASWEIISTTNVNRVAFPRWLPDDARFVASGEGGLRLFDAATGSVIREFLGLRGGAWQTEVFADGTRLAVASASAETTVIFDTTTLGITEVAAWRATGPEAWTAGYADATERIVLSNGGTFSSNEPFSYSSYSENGMPQGGAGGGNGFWFPWLALRGGLITFLEADGTWTARDTMTNEIIYQAPRGFELHGIDDDATRAVVTSFEGITLLDRIPEGDVVQLDMGEAGQVVFDASRRYIATWDFTNSENVLFDAETGQRLASISDARTALAPFFTWDSTRLLLAGWGWLSVFDIEELVSAHAEHAQRRAGLANSNGHLTQADLEALLSGVDGEAGLVDEWATGDNLNLRISVSPDDRLVLTSSWSESLKVWDLESGALAGAFGGPLEGQTLHNGDFHPTRPHLFVASPPDRVRVYTLDLEELVGIAEDSLTRGYTAQECDAYLIPDCGE